MNVFIMAAGSSKRWTEDYPKQMCVVDGEPVIHRTARQLRERGIEPIATAQYEGQWGINDFVTSPNQYEIDRICGVNKEGIYLYGDAYYTDAAIDIILSNNRAWHFFGLPMFEIFAIKANSYVLDCAWNVRRKFIAGVINRCIGWELYAECVHAIFTKYYAGEKKSHWTTVKGCHDFDCVEEYNLFLCGRLK